MFATVINYINVTQFFKLNEKMMVVEKNVKSKKNLGTCLYELSTIHVGLTSSMNLSDKEYHFHISSTHITA